MDKRIVAAATIAAMLAASPAPAQTQAAARHLVYEFGYNTRAADTGPGTGKTTIDVGGPAPDGGVKVTATDEWWNTVRPRQSYTCELYPNGGVKCSQPPYAISPIQVAIVPLLGQSVFTALSSNEKATWNQSYDVHATFAPAAKSGFAGQPSTWKGAYTLTGKGTVPEDPPIVLVQFQGAMKQQSGRYITANQKGNILFDPRIKTPVFVSQAITFVPTLSVNRYTVELKLIRY